MTTSFEAGPLQQVRSDLKDGQEFNAYTLFGANQPIYLDMLRFVETRDEQHDLSDDDLLERLKHHIDRGVAQLSVRIKSAADVAELLSGES
jgi:DNA sulfur modification protein DndE